MTAVRVRTPGNLPETRIFCDHLQPDGAGCAQNTNPPTSWDAREARKVARSVGYGRLNGRDYCGGHLLSMRGASSA